MVLLTLPPSIIVNLTKYVKSYMPLLAHELDYLDEIKLCASYIVQELVARME